LTTTVSRQMAETLNIGNSTTLLRAIAEKWPLVEAENQKTLVAKSQQFRKLVQSIRDLFAIAGNLHDQLASNPETSQYGRVGELQTFLEIAPRLRPFLNREQDSLTCIGLLAVIDCICGFEATLNQSKSRRKTSSAAEVWAAGSEESKANLGGAYLLVLCASLAESNGTEAVAVNGLIDLNWGGCKSRVENALDSVSIRNAEIQLDGGSRFAFEKDDVLISPASRSTSAHCEAAVEDWLGLVKDLADIPIERRSNPMSLSESGVLIFGGDTRRQRKTNGQKVAKEIRLGRYRAFKDGRERYYFDVNSFPPYLQKRFLPGGGS
jgi:hypothetical protein